MAQTNTRRNEHQQQKTQQSTFHWFSLSLEKADKPTANARKKKQ